MNIHHRSKSRASGEEKSEGESEGTRERILEARGRWSFKGLGKEGRRRKVRWR
jgi:hypothetical protein